MDEELLLKRAHFYVLSLDIGDSEDHFYEYEGNLFRFVSNSNPPKSKRICNVIPRLIRSYNSSTNDEHSYKYVFSIYIWRTDTIIEKAFTPKQLKSHNTFNSALLYSTPGGFFLGNKDDFNEYFKAELINLQDKESIKGPTSVQR